LAAVGKYSFVSAKILNKIEAKNQIEKLFKVNVIKINSSNISGKLKISRGHKGKRDNIKKFIFTLKDKQKIDLFDIEDAEKNKSKETSVDKKTSHKFEKDNIVKSQINRGRKENDPTALSMQGGGE